MEVTTRIRDAILAGDLVPNQRLVQIDLADEFGVPRATIREALAELVKEGLVEWLPNKGARVRVVSLDEAIEISELRMVLDSCMATVGAVSNPDHMNQNLGKAGRSRHMGRRPHVRGVAMNPVDHPHGGGEGRTSGGRHPVTPAGKPTKGAKTRVNKATDKFIIRSRHKAKKGR